MRYLLWWIDACTESNTTPEQKKVDRDWAESRFKSINAVPTFVMGRHRLVGVQSYQALTELVTHYGVIARETPAKANKINKKRKDEDS
jgi:predicted DsbA family dithiol-disulfide isomerase